MSSQLWNPVKLFFLDQQFLLIIGLFNILETDASAACSFIVIDLRILSAQTTIVVLLYEFMSQIKDGVLA